MRRSGVWLEARRVDRRAASIVSASVLLSVLIGCGGEPPRLDAGPFDAGPGVDAAPECPSVSGTCTWVGLTSSCTVPCSAPSACTFALSVAWTGPTYCCGPGSEQYEGCVCRDGIVLCPRGPGSEPSTPMSSCESCG